MEEGAGADHFALAGKGDAAFADKLFEILDRLEISVDQRLVYEFPKVFRRLQLGTMRRLKHKPDAIRYSQVFWPMPSGAIELKDNPLVCASARRFGEVQKNALEQLLANRIRNVPHRGVRPVRLSRFAHKEGDRAILDCLREARPPFSPVAVTEEFAATLNAYGVRRGRGRGPQFGPA